MQKSAAIYSRSQLVACLGEAVIQRARPYTKGAITRLRSGRDWLSAEVQGLQKQPYEVDVLLRDTHRTLQIEGVCTCPAGMNCEHVAAVLLVGLALLAETADDGTSSISTVLPAGSVPMSKNARHRPEEASGQHSSPAIRVIDTAPVPVLSFDSLPTFQPMTGRFGRGVRELDFGVLHFDYAGIRVAAGSNATLVTVPDGSVVRIQRRPEEEKAAALEVQQSGLVAMTSAWTFGPQPFPGAMLGLPEPAAWQDFVRKQLPAWRERQWRVLMTPAFHYNVTEIDFIDGAVHVTPGGWFDLEMGVVVHDREIRLEPLLSDLFKRDRRWLSGALESIPDDEAIALKTDREERLQIQAGRLKPVIRVLIDLFVDHGKGKMQIGLQVPALDLGRMSALVESGSWRFDEGAPIRQLLDRLRQGPVMGDAPVPQGLQTTLREYQREGLGWMQFLRAHDLSGVLADDMGLGKTVQTLAHILSEKEAGRLDRPVLIVVPTTLVNNWCEEARRFAPALSVLDLHGPARKDRFAGIASHDLVITTYALLWRDHAVLTQQPYHLLILDEAQYVKNVKGKAATAIRDLRARHRLCLTGTPMENHLGELWSLYDFLMPGFLGSSADFKKYWRKPIEQQQDAARLALLRCRIRPFMLRRRKSEVATELPAKTVIMQSVEISGGQRDLYETVRVAVQAKVRAAFAEHGAARSHIIVLDALLKLRQVCCDPRLVRLELAARIQESAKLEQLLLMLPALVEEGRRILVFSQFTGMLALIAESLDQMAQPYLLLTGDTGDRVTPVRRFQNLEVPVFLISLKAGGVGLNLTAADTVIHYDPWWNPAAENQATDRAHRLGQDKAVFVYKLIAAGTIEEKIVALQQRKSALADQVLSEDATGAVKFSIEELEALLAPLPDVAAGNTVMLTHDYIEKEGDAGRSPLFD